MALEPSASSPDAAALARIRELEAILASAGPPPVGSYFGHLRLATHARQRDILLGASTHVFSDRLAVLDWERAPLAAVFFEIGEDEDYEIEVEGRVLEGHVLSRSLLELDGEGRLVGIETRELALRRDGDRWLANARAPVHVPPRPAARRRFIATMEVELAPEQRRVVELPAERSCLVLGEAGFGKTTVALHRLVWLRHHALAAHRRFDALVVVPTEGLRRLTRMVLERMGAPEVEVMRFDAWIEREGRAVFRDVPERTSVDTTALVSRLKRHPALFDVLDDVARGTAAMRELGEHRAGQAASRRDLLHLFGDRALLDRVRDQAGGVLTARAVTEVLAHTRVQFSRTTEQEFHDVDPERLQTVDGRRIDEGTPMQDADSLDVEDFAVLFELDRRKTGRVRGPDPGLRAYDHIVLDEAQELAPIELRVLGRALEPGGSITVAGDEAQQLDASNTFRGFPATMDDLGRPAHEAVRLTESFRCPPAVERLARVVAGLRVPDAGERFGGPGLSLHAFANPCHAHAAMIEAFTELMAIDPTVSVTIIVRTAADARRLYASLSRGISLHRVQDGDFRFQRGVQVTHVDEVKGLEFDVVVVPDATPDVYPATLEARRALYVAMTRATHWLWLGTYGPWSPLLARAV